MKQKLLTIMLLVLGAVLGVQAEDQTLVDFPSNMDGITISGTTASGKVKIHKNVDEVSCLTLKNGYTKDGAYNNNSINLAVEGGFKKGDVITIAGATNVKQEDVDKDTEGKKRAAAVIFTMDESQKITRLHQTPDFINGNITNHEPAEDSYILEADAEKLYIGRDGGTQAHVVMIKVVRAAGEVAGTPAITFEAPAVERTITVGLNAPGTVKVDWGDGTLVEQTATAAYDGYENGIEFTGTPSGTVKIYGEGVNYFVAFTKLVDNAVVGGITSVDLSNAPDITELDLHQNNLTTVDLSALKALKKLTLGVNDMETVDLSSNTALTTLDVSSTVAIEGKLTSLNLSKNTALTSLRANYNKISSIDLSNNTSLKNIYLLNNGLTSVDFGNNTTAKIYISLNNNKLESLDVTALTGLSNGTLFAMNNNLTELKHGAVKTMNITGNKFDLPGLYDVIQDVTTPTYASEQDYEIPATIEGSIDLSSQATVNEAASTITWKTESGTVLVAGTDYTVENGVYTFIKEQTEKIYAEMSNPTSLPKLTTPIKTTLATVVATTGGSDEPGEKPAITFEAPAVERTITIGLASAGQKAIVDWGDGVKNEMEATAGMWGDVQGLEFTGTPSGTVKVYGDEIVSFTAFTKYEDGTETITNGITSIDLSNATSLTELDIHQNNLTTVDLSKLTALTKLTIGVNDFETFDISANTELTNLDASNGKANGLLSSIDLSKNTKLTTINLSGNKLASVDLSNNTSAKTVQLLNNQLTSVNLGANTNKNHTINLGNNKLTEVDLSSFTNLTGSYIYLRDNDLTGTDAIKLPEGVTVKRLWVDGNAFTLSQLYELKGQATQTYTYATTFTKPEAQQPMEITADGSVVDLSSEAMLGESATVFTWKTSDGTALEEDTDYTVENGVFTFLADFENIYCEMTNAELPAFTAAKPFKTTQVSVTGSAPGEVDPSALLAEIEEAKKLLDYDFAYYDENTDDPGKALVDAIRSAEEVAENASSQKKIEKELEALKEAEMTYSNAVLAKEIAESEALLTLADEDDDLAKSLAEAVKTAKEVLADDTSVPANKIAWADLLNNYEKEWLTAQLTEKVDEANGLLGTEEPKNETGKALKEAAENGQAELDNPVNTSESLTDAYTALVAALEAYKADPTAIRALEAADSDDAPVYNMNGQRVSSSAKGIVIKNGKKVFVK